jgi:hypothetical protein
MSRVDLVHPQFTNDSAYLVLLSGCPGSDGHFDLSGTGFQHDGAVWAISPIRILLNRIPTTEREFELKFLTGLEIKFAGVGVFRLATKFYAVRFPAARDWQGPCEVNRF